MTDSLDDDNEFNNFFISIGPKLANNLKSDIDPLLYVNYNINSTLLKIKLYIYGESLAAAGCQRLALNLRPAMVTVK